MSSPKTMLMESSEANSKISFSGNFWLNSIKTFFLKSNTYAFQVIRWPKILSGVTTSQVHFVVLAPLTGVPVS